MVLVTAVQYRVVRKSRSYAARRLTKSFPDSSTSVIPPVLDFALHLVKLDIKAGQLLEPLMAHPLVWCCPPSKLNLRGNCGTADRSRPRSF